MFMAAFLFIVRACFYTGKVISYTVEPSAGHTNLALLKVFFNREETKFASNFQNLGYSQR